MAETIYDVIKQRDLARHEVRELRLECEQLRVLCAAAAYALTSIDQQPELVDALHRAARRQDAQEPVLRAPESPPEALEEGVQGDRTPQTAPLNGQGGYPETPRESPTLTREQRLVLRNMPKDGTPIAYFGLEMETGMRRTRIISCIYELARHGLVVRDGARWKRA